MGLWTDRRMDRTLYGDAWSHLKIINTESINKHPLVTKAKHVTLNEVDDLLSMSGVKHESRPSKPIRYSFFQNAKHMTSNNVDDE